MPRNAKIRWRKSDAERIANLTRRFNAKITRVSKNNPEIAAIQPSRLVSQELQKKLKNYPRQVFNRELAKMERYLRQGAEMPYTTREGVNITVWQKKEIDNTFRSINAKRRVDMAKFEPSPYKGNLYAIETENLQPRKNTIQSIKPRDWEKFVTNLEKQQLARYDTGRMQIYKDNYLRAVAEVYSENSDLYKYVSELSAETVAEAVGNPLVDINFVYDLTEQTLKERTIKEQFEQIKGNKG